MLGLTWLPKHFNSCFGNLIHMELTPRDFFSLHNKEWKEMGSDGDRAQPNLDSPKSGALHRKTPLGEWCWHIPAFEDVRDQGFEGDLGMQLPKTAPDNSMRLHSSSPEEIQLWEMPQA